MPHPSSSRTIVVLHGPVVPRPSPDLPSAAAAVLVVLGSLATGGGIARAQDEVTEDPGAAPADEGGGAPAPLRTVVFPFEGPRRESRRARILVAQAVDGTLEVVGRDELRAAIDEFQIDIEREDAAMELATVVAAPIILVGEVTGRGGRATTTIIAVDANNEELGRREAGSPLSRRGRGEIEAAAQELALEAGFVYEERRRQQLEAARQAEIEAARQAELDEELLDEMGVAEGEPGADGDDADGGEGPANPSLYPLVQVTGGLTFRNRTVDIDRTGPTGTAVLPVQYDVPGLFPELSLHIEVRPLNGQGAIPAGFVTWLDFAVALGLESETEPPDSEQLDTSAFRVEGGVGYLYPVGIFQAGVNLGVGYDAFDLEENQILPSTEYTYLRIGLDGRLRLVDGIVEPRIFFGYRLVLGVNDELTDAFGSDTTATGLDVGAGVAGVIWEGLTYLVRFDYVRWNLSFDGVPAVDRGVEDPMDLMAPRGRDGTDDGIRITAHLGWSF
jgi:hypothetical protein